MANNEGQGRGGAVKGSAERDVGKERFGMVKKHHGKTMQKAIDEKVIDEKMVSLCRYIAGTEKYFTSSSCAGRVLLLALPKGEDKKDAYFHRRWHREVNAAEIWKALQEETKGEVWLKQEPFIIHMGCDGLEDAEKILSAMKEAGVKRGGIIVAKQGKFIVELQGTGRISVPLKKGVEILIDEKYLGFVVHAANKKLMGNYARLKKFESVCRKMLK
ncbi:hypothetical protein KKH30_04205 [Candidatus Micrarchaeota archaeon]|nr:hypothetical protein [Candidatus Micrarchaeota archaeon]